MNDIGSQQRKSWRFNVRWPVVSRPKPQLLSGGWKCRVRAMWSKIPDLQGKRAADNWLRDVAPERQKRVRNRYEASIEAVKQSIGNDADLLRAFKFVIDQASFLGRVAGLREGLELYEYGTRIQNENTPAFRAIMNYVVQCAEELEGDALGEAVSAERVCKYLDREIERIKSQKTSAVEITPPDSWACDSWCDALSRKKNNVHRLLHKARKEALSPQFCTLMAWKTWARDGNPKKRQRP